MSTVIPHEAPSPDFYNILGIHHDVSRDDIKIAYRRTLLRHHPDKQPGDTVVGEMVADMALVKEAYETLSDARLRAEYDRSLKRGLELDARPRPRPAQVVSLEEFTVVDVPVRNHGVIETVRGTSRLSPPGSEALAVRQEWHHQCRCGGTYRVTENDLENGTHLVGCESCSEVVWVGYEEVVTENEEGSDASFQMS